MGAKIQYARQLCVDSARSQVSCSCARIEGACGGSLDTQVGDGGTSGGANGGTNRDAATGSPAGTSSSPSPTSTATLGYDRPPNGSVTYDAGCSTSIAALGATLGACWACASMGCASELNACEADCACNTALAQALECSQSGGSSLPCFMPIFSTSDDARGARTPPLAGERRVQLSAGRFHARRGAGPGSRRRLRGLRRFRRRRHRRQRRMLVDGRRDLRRRRLPGGLLLPARQLRVLRSHDHGGELRWVPLLPRPRAGGPGPLVEQPGLGPLRVPALTPRGSRLPVCIPWASRPRGSGAPLRALRASAGRAPARFPMA